MQDSADTFCRLCLNTISGENFKVINETILHGLNLGVEEDIKPAVCTVCSMRLSEAYQFKTTCIDTEDNISPHVDSENVTPVDLREIYLKVNGTEHLGTITEDEQICRLCMHIVTSGFVSAMDVEIEMIHICIPEINFSLVKEPVICAACLDSLNAHSSFLKSCLKVTEQTKGFHNDGESPFCIKVEEVEIKSEENVEDGDNHNRSSLLSNQIKTEELSKLQQYECDACDFKTPHKRSITRHQLKHNNLSEIRIYNCDECDFKTKYKHHLPFHKLTHRDSSAVQTYNCDTCNYKTKFKRNLSYHKLIHKDSSEVQTYYCYTCDYKTKHKRAISIHQVTHKDSSEVQMYKCDKCDYVSKRKCDLKLHQLTHKDPSEIEMYKCDVCSYVTKYKKSLKNHQLTHKGSSEIQMYKCDKYGTCDFETKHKKSLKVHLLRHKDVSEIQLYKCDECDYKAKQKYGLVRHQRRRHKNVSEGHAASKPNEEAVL